MVKYYLANVLKDVKENYRKKFKAGKVIFFEMPPFCSGDYTAKIYKDELGLYINKEDNYFKGCRNFTIL